MTITWQVNPQAVDEAVEGDVPASLLEAARLLAAGETVAFPTETVYGLGADATNTAAVEAVFRAKGRPSDNPLIVHIADWTELDGLVAEEGFSDTARLLMARFWPGPLTLVLPARPGAVSPRVTAGLATVAVRMPAHPVARALIRAAGCPVAAPSANRSGRPSPTLAAHVHEDLDGRIAGLVDGGPTGVGLESTVVEVVGDQVHILRPGGVTAGQLQAAAPACTIVAPGAAAGAEAASPGDAAAYTPKSPGVKYAHYAPRGAMTLVRTQPPAGGAANPAATDAAVAWIQARVNEARRVGDRTGILTTRERAPLFDADLVLACGSADDLEAAAHSLYAALRRFDEAGVTAIWAETYPEEGLGAALMNRMLKAAGGRLVDA
ncbi:L-threonylcarbamoyladenylate synthase [Paenibacillus sp. HJGM_3]|uniref:L-threonylcarbamoyladenylate synthase n=1 Tax=Paenibacillus sp. HJGM_3 TaxID=3379816 RepID=UPI0038600277